MSLLDPELEAAFEEGVACGKGGEGTPDKYPFIYLEQPGNHTEWMNGFTVGRAEGGYALVD